MFALLASAAEWTGPGDGRCTRAPDAILGVDLLPVCQAHDLSALGLNDHYALAAGILAAFVAAWRGRGRLAHIAAVIVGTAVGAVYGAATALWGCTRPVRRWWRSRN